MRFILASATLTLVFAGPLAAADQFTPALESFYQQELTALARNPVLLEAVTEQNTQTAGYSADKIDELDKKWRAEVGAASTPTITPVLEGAAAELLRDQVTAFGGRVTEIFVMDAQGLNVAASATTSDYWQGDEEKHAMTYGVGPDAVHISDVELDESTQRYQGQISFTLSDPATGQPIGAITVGVDAEALM